jgi:hypothetical protein
MREEGRGVALQASVASFVAPSTHDSRGDVFKHFLQIASERRLREYIPSRPDMALGSFSRRPG